MARRAELLPALVIEPWRRRWPEESSEGISPREGMSFLGESKRWKSPSSATMRTAWISQTSRSA
jgi:hypothetical protein